MTMRLTELLEEAWQTLEAGGHGGRTRKVDDLGIDDKRLQLGVEAGCRELVVETTGKADLRVPATRVVRVLTRAVGSADRAANYLVIRCTSADFHGVFVDFTAALLERVRDSESLAADTIVLLREWQEMFARADRSTRSSIVGIFGELAQLVGLARRNPTAVDTWGGPMGQPQDFVRGPVALELKTSSVRVSEVEIHGLEQLWAAPYECLAVGVTRIVEDPEGDSLEALVDRLVRLGVRVSDLEDRLALVGWNAQARRESRERYATRGTTYYRVGSGTPALTPDHLRGPLPSGVERLRYTVALDDPGFERMDGDEVESMLSRLAGAVSA